MMITAEPFLGAETEYRRQRITEDFRRQALRRQARAGRPGQRRRRLFVPRRPHLRLPGQRRRPVAVA